MQQALIACDRARVAIAVLVEFLYMRSQPDFKDQYPPVTAADVQIYDDECRSRVISGQRVITLSFDVPAATGSDSDVDGIYVLISTVEAVDDLDPAAVLIYSALGP